MDSTHGQGSETKCPVELTEAQWAALKLGFGSGRSNQFERDVCSPYVAKQLEAKGLVERHSTPRHGGTLLRITDAGRAVLKEGVR